MFLHSPPRFPLLVLLALAPLTAMGADREELIDTVAAYQLFGATARCLDGSNEAAEKAVGEQCLTFGRQCIEFAFEQADVVLAAVHNEYERMFGFIADRSEAGWEGFWRHGLDVS